MIDAAHCWVNFCGVIYIYFYTIAIYWRIVFFLQENLMKIISDYGKFNTFRSLLGVRSLCHMTRGTLIVL